MSHRPVIYKISKHRYHGLNKKQNQNGFIDSFTNVYIYLFLDSDIFWFSTSFLLLYPLTGRLKQ